MRTQLMTHHGQGRGSSPVTNLPAPWSCTSQPPDLWEIFIFKPHHPPASLWYFLILLGQPEQTETAPLPYHLEMHTPPLPLWQGASYFLKATCHLRSILPFVELFFLQRKICPPRLPHDSSPVLWTGIEQSWPLFLGVPSDTFADRDHDHSTHFRFLGHRSHVYTAHFHTPAPCIMLPSEEKPYTDLLVEWIEVLYCRVSIFTSFNSTSKNLVSSLFSIFFSYHVITLTFQKLNFCTCKRMRHWFLHLDKFSFFLQLPFSCTPLPLSFHMTQTPC